MASRLDFPLGSKPENGKVKSIVEGSVTRRQFLIRSQYVCAADGGNSKVARDVGFHFVEQPASSVSINVKIEAEMGHILATTPGMLHTLTGDPEEHLLKA
ncbi:hypothetical protein LTR37_001389 [Vermiconidia calcicola]|uniref:Uncharacterized protein n=1 Tax=Vermiconidia calcicola TaxID=1690605 RepID=A0ACC3NYB0_9PEZI|nr:hypothetical protein LTR37_001389 [Vermiconidia calcicola]